MEKIPQHPTVVTYNRTGDLRLDHPRLRLVNGILNPVFRTVDLMRYDIRFMEAKFRPVNVSRDEGMKILSSVDSRLQPLAGEYHDLTRLVQSIKYADLVTRKPIDPKPYSFPEQEDPTAYDPRRIVLSGNLSIKELLRRVNVSEHDLKTPLTGLTTAVQLQLRRLNQGREFDWDIPRNRYFRLKSFLYGWEDRLEGKSVKEEIPVSQLHKIMIDAISRGLKNWLTEKANSDEESDKTGEVVANILHIDNLPDDQKALFATLPYDEFETLGENIGQNLIRFMEEKGGTDHFVALTTEYDPANSLWKFGVHDDLKGLSDEMYDKTLGEYRFRRGQSYSADPNARGIGMENATTVLKKSCGLTYKLWNNEIRGASQVFSVPVIK